MWISPASVNSYNSSENHRPTARPTHRQLAPNAVPEVAELPGETMSDSVLNRVVATVELPPLCSAAFRDRHAAAGITRRCLRVGEVRPPSAGHPRCGNVPPALTLLVAHLPGAPWSLWLAAQHSLRRQVCGCHGLRWAERGTGPQLLAAQHAGCRQEDHHEVGPSGAAACALHLTSHFSGVLALRACV